MKIKTIFTIVAVLAFLQVLPLPLALVSEDFKAMLTGWNLKGKVLFVAPEFSENEILAARNIPTVQFATASHVSVYDILHAKNLVLTKDAALALQEVLSHE